MQTLVIMLLVPKNKLSLRMITILLFIDSSLREKKPSNDKFMDSFSIWLQKSIQWKSWSIICDAKIDVTQKELIIFCTITYCDINLLKAHGYWKGGRLKHFFLKKKDWVLRELWNTKRRCCFWHKIDQICTRMSLTALRNVKITSVEGMRNYIYMWVQFKLGYTS